MHNVPEEWLDEKECDDCGIETQHVYYSAGHERDSSGDWTRCLACGLTYYGFSSQPIRNDYDDIDHHLDHLRKKYNYVD